MHKCRCGRPTTEPRCERCDYARTLRAMRRQSRPVQHRGVAARLLAFVSLLRDA